MESEKDLVELFIRYIQHKKRNSVIITEVDTEFGRPDILEIIVDDEIIEKRRKDIRYESFDKNMQFSMAYLYGKGWVKANSLIKFLKINIKDGEKMINKLLESNLIYSKNEYIKSYSCKELLAIKRIIAYEAKLDNWKVAVNQAQRHKWFTNESYIVLDNKSEAVKNKIINSCKKMEVGTIIINEKNKFKNYNNLKKTRVINTPLMWKINESIVKGGVMWKNNLMSY